MNKWTTEEIEDYRQWHERRICECGYSEKLSGELRKSREAFLLKATSKKIAIAAVRGES